MYGNVRVRSFLLDWILCVIPLNQYVYTEHVFSLMKDADNMIIDSESDNFFRFLIPSYDLNQTENKTKQPTNKYRINDSINTK